MMNVQSLWSERPLVAGRWTIKDVVQGKPVRHPSHPLFVHFPTALLPTALVFDLISRFDGDLTLTRAAFYNIATGLTVAALAAITGLVDYLPMIGGSRKKRLGTYHLIGQVVAMSTFALSLVLRAFDYGANQTALPALGLAGIGALAIGVANYYGGELVYQQGMRVSVDS